MYGIGIDISKGKSTVAVIDENERVIEKPFEVLHNEIGIQCILEKIK